MTLQCHFECFSTLDIKSSLRFCSYTNPEKGRINFWDLKVHVLVPQSESIQHPASLSCRRQTAASAPLPHCPLKSKAAGTAEGFRGISRIKGVFLEQLEGSMFWLLALPESQKIWGSRAHQTHLQSVCFHLALTNQVEQISWGLA